MLRQITSLHQIYTLKNTIIVQTYSLIMFMLEQSLCSMRSESVYENKLFLSKMNN